MRCHLCGSIFHKPCFRKLDGCSCGKPSRAGSSEDSTGQMIHVNDTESNGVLDHFVRQSDALSGMLSNLLKARPAKRLQSKRSSPVILMGSLPSTSL